MCWLIASTAADVLPLSIVSMIALCRSRDIEGCVLTGPAATMTTRSRPSRWRQVSTRTLFFDSWQSKRWKLQVGVDAGDEVGGPARRGAPALRAGCPPLPRGQQMR